MCRDKPTASGFGHKLNNPELETEKFMEPEKFGYEIVNSIYSEDHDTFCVILRHIKTKHVVVMFRYQHTTWEHAFND